MKTWQEVNNYWKRYEVQKKKDIEIDFSKAPEDFWMKLNFLSKERKNELINLNQKLQRTEKKRINFEHARIVFNMK